MARRQEWHTTGDDGESTPTGNDDYFAQTFTLGTTGNNLTFNISQIKLFLSKTGSPTGNLTFEIQGTQPDGSPDGIIISTGTIDMASLTTTNTWRTITMSTGTLEAGQKYAIVKKDAFIDGSNRVNWRFDASAPSYGGGEFWNSVDAGVNWEIGAGTDFLFQVEGGSYEGILCTLADAVNKAGANASSGSKEEVLVSDYVRQAEGFINSATRKNWIDAYPGLSDDVKFILNQITSSLAAIDIITYDMAGYTSRVEAESMINIYREEVNRALFFLVDKNTQKFMEGV